MICDATPASRSLVRMSLLTNLVNRLLCELWPRTALLTDKMVILRAMSTGDNAHSSSGYYMLTGQPHAPMNAENVNPGFPNDYPNLGATVRKMLPARGQLPTSIRLPHRIFNTDGSVWPGQDAGFLGQAAEPWLLNCQSANPGFRIDEFNLNADITEQRLQERRSLLNHINTGLQGTDNRATLNAPCWDSHASEAQRLKTVLCPPADQALSALIEDLETRGM